MSLDSELPSDSAKDEDTDEDESEDELPLAQLRVVMQQ